MEKIFYLFLILPFFFSSCSDNDNEDSQTNKIIAIKIAPIDKNIYIGDEVSLDIVLTPQNAKGPELYWSSSNAEIASIDNKTGKLLALKTGDVTITVDVPNLDLKAELDLKIMPKQVTGIKLDRTELELFIGDDKLVILHYTIEPEDATESIDVTWTSTNDKIVTVNEYGRLVAISEGTATITVSNGSINDECVVTVPKSLFGYKWDSTIEDVNPAVKLSEDFGYNWLDNTSEKYKPFTAFKFEKNKLKSIWHAYDSSISFRDFDNFFKEIEGLNPPKKIEHEVVGYGEYIKIKEDNLEWRNGDYKILIRNGEILMRGENVPVLIVEYRLAL